MTSPRDDVTSATTSRRWMCPLLTQSAATSRTSDHQLTLARYSSRRRRRTVDGHGGRLQCPWDLSFLRREYVRRVDWVCRRWTCQWWRTPRRQRTWCYPALSVDAPCLQHTVDQPINQSINQSINSDN